MKFEIKNRWSGDVQFVAEIECDEKASLGIKVGLAVRWAFKSGAVLRGAVLSGADLSGADLRGADLSGADLSDAVLRGAVLRGADLSGADLRGAVLSDAVLRGAVLRGADLSGAVLRGADLSDAVLRGAVLRGADLSGAVLSGAVLSDAVLSDAVLSGAVLRGAVLSENSLEGVPFIKDIHKAVYEAACKPDALDMGNWHSCDTTHCRAGWVVHLAGDAGRAMEYCLGTPAAAALIYLKSDPKIEKIPDFYCSNEAALADMKRLAEAS